MTEANAPARDRARLSMPRVSVIIPFHNSARTLAATLDSLQQQTMPHWEGLLVDDASTDGSAALARGRAAIDPRLRLIKASRNLGPAGARNLGISAARARFVACLDSDDLWRPEKLAAQLPVLESGVPLVFSAYEQIDASGNMLRRVRAPERVRYHDLLDGNPIGCLTAIWDRTYFGPVAFPLIPMHEDYAFWLTLLRQGGYGVGLPQVLAQYRVSGQSHSSQKWRAALAVWSILRSQPDISFPRTCLGFARYASRGLARRL